jgi:Zn-dependent peptidase ImmA (M78 family)
MIATKPSDYAKALHRKYNSTVPVDVYAIAEGEGVFVEEVELEPNVSGFLILKEDEVVIGVNKSHHPFRKRFTIAHELGHHLIHGPKAASNVMTEEGEFVYFRDNTSESGEVEQEREANQFAADLLMPRDLLKTLVPTKIKMTDETSIRKLAVKFDVSFTAMSIRLSTLKMVH